MGSIGYDLTEIVRRGARCVMAARATRGGLDVEVSDMITKGPESLVPRQEDTRAMFVARAKVLIKA